MKKFLPILIALVIGIAVGALVFRNGSGFHDHPPVTTTGEATKPEVWTCSMHPQVQAPKPGLCPICAMELIPLSELGGGGRRARWLQRPRLDHATTDQRPHWRNLHLRRFRRKDSLSSRYGDVVRPVS